MVRAAPHNTVCAACKHHIRKRRASDRCYDSGVLALVSHTRGCGYETRQVQSKNQQQQREKRAFYSGLLSGRSSRSVVRLQLHLCGTEQSATSRGGKALHNTVAGSSVSALTPALLLLLWLEFRVRHYLTFQTNK